MTGAPAAACCCTGTPSYPSSVSITAHLGTIRAFASSSALNDPRDPATFPSPDPPTTCDIDPPVLPCLLSCGCSDTRPDDTVIACPDGSGEDAPRPWGSGTLTVYYGAEWYFRDDPLTLPFDAGAGTTDVGSSLTYYMTPPGGGSAVAVGSGDWECDYYKYYDEPEQPVPYEYAVCGAYNCYGTQDDSEVVVEPVTCEYRGRKRWTAPPVVMKVKAPALGWTLGIASDTLTVVDALAVTHTLDLTTVDVDGAVSWMQALLLVVTDAGGGTWSGEPIGPFDAELLGDQATASIPSGIAPAMPLWIHNVGESITMPDDDDHEAEAYWTITISDDGGTTKVSFEVPWHKFTGTEDDLLWGFGADYETDDYLESVQLSLEDWGYGGIWGNLLPIPGQDYTDHPIMYVQPGAVGTFSVCWTNTTSEGALWEQSLDNCWIACNAYAHRNIEGGLALWVLVGNQ